MIVSKSALELFHISRDTVSTLRENLAALEAENRALKTEITTTKANFEWLRTRVNTLEMERAQLIKKAYNIDLPVPEIARTQSSVINFDASLFQDMGDEKAKELGLPIYGN